MVTHDPVESQSLKEKMHNPALQRLKGLFWELSSAFHIRLSLNPVKMDLFFSLGHHIGEVMIYCVANIVPHLNWSPEYSSSEEWAKMSEMPINAS